MMLIFSKKVFNGSFVEDSVSMNDLAESQLRQIEETAKHKTKKEQSDIILASLTRFLDVLPSNLFLFLHKTIKQ